MKAESEAIVAELHSRLMFVRASLEEAHDGGIILPTRTAIGDCEKLITRLIAGEKPPEEDHVDTLGRDMQENCAGIERDMDTVREWIARGYSTTTSLPEAVENVLRAASLVRVAADLMQDTICDHVAPK